MRCRKCGIEIANGTLCEYCYENLKKTRNVENDDNLLLKLTRKFLPKYELIQNWEWFLIGIMMISVSIAAKNFVFAICSIILIGMILGIHLLVKKRIVVGTKCYFYESKVVYTFNFLFIHKRKVLKYEEIKDIGYNQTSLQKKFGLGALIIFSKKSGFLFNGIRINDIANINDTFGKIAQLVGDKIN